MANVSDLDSLPVTHIGSEAVVLLSDVRALFAAAPAAPAPVVTVRTLEFSHLMSDWLKATADGGDAPKIFNSIIANIDAHTAEAVAAERDHTDSLRDRCNQLEDSLLAERERAEKAEQALAVAKSGLAEASETLKYYLASAKNGTQPAEGQIKQAVDRFLGWKLPQDFGPDCGISFDGRKDDEWNKSKQWPIGTNLLTADQAKAMFEYCLAGQASAPVAAMDGPLPNEEKPCRSCDSSVGYVCDEHGDVELPPLPDMSGYGEAFAKEMRFQLEKFGRLCLTTIQTAPAAISNAFVTLESSDGRYSIVMKFNQSADAFAVHSYLLGVGGREGNAAPVAAAVAQGYELLPCPFCGCEMRFDSNRDWHRINGEHLPDCVFSDVEDAAMMVPATKDGKAWAVTTWNSRATQPPANAAPVYAEAEQAEEGDTTFDGIFTQRLNKHQATIYNALKAAGRTMLPLTKAIAQPSPAQGDALSQQAAVALPEPDVIGYTCIGDNDAYSPQALRKHGDARHQQGRAAGIDAADQAVRAVLHARESAGLHEQACGIQDALFAINSLNK